MKLLLRAKTFKSKVRSKESNQTLSSLVLYYVQYMSLDYKGVIIKCQIHLKRMS